jgi:predicted MFS family arabinose efflux permease
MQVTDPVQGQDSARRPSESRIVLILFFALLLASIDNQLLIPLLPTLAHEFSVSVEQMAWMLSGYALSAAAFNLVLGPLTDYFGRSLFLRLGLFAFVFLELSAGFSQTYLQLFTVRVFAGAAAGLLSTCTAGLLGDVVPYERRGRAMGIVLSSYFAAMILGIPLSAALAQEVGWRMVLRAGGVAALLLAVSAWRDLARIEAPAVIRRSILSDYRTLLLAGRTSGALVVSFLVSGGTLAFLTYISAHLGDVFQLEAFQISMVFLLGGVAAVLASPVSGWLSDRWTKRRVFLVFNSLLVIPLLLLTRVGFGSMLFLLVFLVSLAVAFRQTALQTLQTELIPSQQRGTFLAIRNCFSQLGISLSVVVGGFLYSRHGYLGVALLAASLTVLGSVILFARVGEPKSERAS